MDDEEFLLKAFKELEDTRRAKSIQHYLVVEGSHVYTKPGYFEPLSPNFQSSGTIKNRITMKVYTYLEHEYVGNICHNNTWTFESSDEEIIIHSKTYDLLVTVLDRIYEDVVVEDKIQEIKLQ